MAENQPGEQTPPQSPGANQTANSNPDVNNLGDPSVLEPSAEQAEWEQLSGKSQDRFSEMYKRARTSESQVSDLNTRLQQAEADLKRLSQIPTQTNQYQDPREAEVDRAIDTLKQKKAFATYDEVQDYVQEQVNLATRNLKLQDEHSRLKRKYDRLAKKDKRYPIYDPDMIEDYGRRNNIFNPEAAFRDMYWDEILDIERGGGQKRQPVSDKPGASNSGSREQPLTVESLREKLSGPKGREWYDKQMRDNPEEFQQQIAQLTQG